MVKKRQGIKAAVIEVKADGGKRTAEGRELKDFQPKKRCLRF